MAAMSYEEFCHVHEHQLKSINFPPNLKKNLYNYFSKNESKKLSDVFEIRKSGNSRPILLSRQDFDKNNSFYLIDHIWTVDCHSFLQQLKKSPSTVEELASIFNISPPPELQSFYSNSLQVASILPLAKDKSFEDVEKIVENNNGDTIISAVNLDVGDDEKEQEDKTSDNGNNENDCTFEEFVKAMRSSENIPENANEAYLYKMYQNFLTKDHGSATTQNYNWIEEDGLVSVYVAVPTITSKHSIKSDLKSTSWKLVVDGKTLVDGKLYGSVKHDDSYWSIESPGLFCLSLEKVSKEKTWKELILGEEQLSPKEIMLKSWLMENNERLYHEEVLDSMWKYNQTYSIASQQGSSKQPLWYIMDKYGSALSHSNNPNFRCSPFFYAAENKAYSLLWPTQDVKIGNLCSRNFIPQIMANENLNICKTRLKAFTEKNIYSDKIVKTDSENLSESLKINITKYEEITKIELKLPSKYCFKTFPKEITRKVINGIADTKLTDAKNADIIISPLNDMLIYLAEDFLPANEMLRNKDYLNNYLQYKLSKQHNEMFGKHFVLPRDLVEFNEVFERSNLPEYWIVKPVDTKLIDIPTFVTTHYSRIVRMCETGSISVSQYVANQPKFREHRFALSYTMIITPNKSLYIHTTPSIRHTMEKYIPNDIIDEFETSKLLAPKNSMINTQIDWYNELKVTMNKMMLVQNPDRGWKEVENVIYQKIGSIGQNIAKDMHQDSDKTYVVFGIDVVFNGEIQPIVVDVDGECSLPNEHSLHELLMLTKGEVSKHFVKVE